MKQIEKHSYVTEKDPRHPVPCYMYKPDNPEDDSALEMLGWNRKNLIGTGNYFYWTESLEHAEQTAEQLDLNIDVPQVGIIWRI